MCGPIGEKKMHTVSNFGQCTCRCEEPEALCKNKANASVEIPYVLRFMARNIINIVLK